jgi:uncharacterized protein (TIGR03435 family)
MYLTKVTGAAVAGAIGVCVAVEECQCARRLAHAFWQAMVPAVRATGAQTPPPAAGGATQATRKVFEAATIRENKEPGMLGGQQRRLPGGRFVATKFALRGLLRIAYGNATIFRNEDQMIGVPGWVDSVKFDIDAKAAEEFKPDADGIVREHLAMLRSLLEDTFKIKARVETRELPIYHLLRVREDSFGPKFRDSTADCRPGAPPPAEGHKCGITNLGPGKGNALRGVPINALLAWLRISPAVDRLVYDKTGLTGTYDLELYFAPPFVLGPAGAVPNPDVDAGPTIFTALREQLGLKLEPARGPVEVLVIEHMERLVEKR